VIGDDLNSVYSWKFSGKIAAVYLSELSDELIKLEKLIPE